MKSAATRSLKMLLLSGLMINTACATTMLIPEEMKRDGKLYEVSRSYALQTKRKPEIRRGEKRKTTHPGIRFGEWEILDVESSLSRAEEVVKQPRRGQRKRALNRLYSRHETFGFRVTREKKDFVDVHCDVYGFDRIVPYRHGVGVSLISCFLLDQKTQEVWELHLGADGEVLEGPPPQRRAPRKGAREDRWSHQSTPHADIRSPEVRSKGLGSFSGTLKMADEGTMSVKYTKEINNGYSTYFPTGFLLILEGEVQGAADLLNSRSVWLKKTDNLEREAMMAGVGVCLVVVAKRHALPARLRLNINTFEP